MEPTKLERNYLLVRLCAFKMLLSKWLEIQFMTIVFGKKNCLKGNNLFMSLDFLRRLIIVY